MSKRFILECKVMEGEHAGKTFTITNPFGKWGSRRNDPENIMILQWTHIPTGSTYIYDHAYSRRKSDYMEKLKPKNVATVSTICGEKVTLDLKGLSEEQSISEVIIRGNKYRRC